jgi:hypothetical protein
MDRLPWSSRRRAVNAEQESLESIAPPLAAEEAAS